MTPTSTATARPTRRQSAADAIVTAHIRRLDQPQQMTRWLAGMLVSLAAGPMSDHDIAETVRGLADGWQQIQPTGGAE
jgi:hypothetical protein